MTRQKFTNTFVRRISTHTLTWSVTFEFKLIILLSKISTHTLTWSVTKIQV